MPSPLLRALCTATELNLFTKKIKSKEAELLAKVTHEQVTEPGVKPQSVVSKLPDLYLGVAAPKGFALESLLPPLSALLAELTK